MDLKHQIMISIFFMALSTAFTALSNLVFGGP